MAFSHPEGAAGSSAPRYRIYDPLREEWAAPLSAVSPMTPNAAGAALFDAEGAAVLRSRQLIGPERPWLVMQPPHRTGKGIA